MPLYCSPRKSQLFCTEVDFLRHHISIHSIKPDPSKIKCIINWPVPKSSTEVSAFLGLVHYITDFLPNLAKRTHILTPLTHKMADKLFPSWDDCHQNVFQAIKNLVIGSDCLTTINHN